jgi:ribosomal protein S14
MKKTVKKLSLSRETLRNLNEELLGIAGGAVDTSLQYSRCASCGIACTVPRLSCTCTAE